MGRVSSNQSKQSAPVRRSKSRTVPEPSKKELQECLSGLESLTNGVKQIQQKWVPDTYDFDILALKFKRLTLDVEKKRKA